MFQFKARKDHKDIQEISNLTRRRLIVIFLTHFYVPIATEVAQFSDPISLSLLISIG
ncbi:MAG: hypothetical protein M8353_11685 [ANME-2 cluster archaeon]|nr:hypothetical protein [ANME-2 cluster archaeon]